MNRTLCCKLTIATLAWLSSISSSACDIPGLQKNVDWLKERNQDSVNQMRRGCNNEFASPEQNLTNIIEGYKFGQRHNPSAQKSIDGCSLPQIIDNVCRRL